MKITYFAAASLDGFIARENGDVSWLDKMNIDPNDSVLEEFFRSVDGLVMGRQTYDFVFEYGTWPYEDKPTWVCTSRDLKPLEGANLIVTGDIEEVVKDASTQGLQHLWLVGGGKLASSFMNNNLITDLSISEMPIYLGTGIPLFSDYKLDDEEFAERKIEQRNGFRQIEIAVK